MAIKDTDLYPQSKAVDVANVVAQAGLGSIPIVGGAVSPIIAALVTAPLEKRRAAWLNRLAAGIKDLERRFDGFDPDALSDNEDFVSAVYATTDAAMKTGRETKRERLANVTLNIAIGKSINEALRERFVGLVQMFAEEHILVLRIGRNPKAFPRILDRAKGILMGGRGGLYQVELSHHGVSDAVFSVVTADLEREGLVQGGFNVTMSGAGLMEPITTPTGNAFLDFISSPFEAKFPSWTPG